MAAVAKKFLAFPLKKSWKLATTQSKFYVRKYCIYTTHLISQFSTWWVRLFPETFLLPFLLVPFHIHFLFFFLWFPFLQHFLFGTRRRKSISFSFSRYSFFFDKLFIIIRRQQQKKNNKFVSLNLWWLRKANESERVEIFQGVVRNPFSRVAIYLWRIKAEEEKKS